LSEIFNLKVNSARYYHTYRYTGLQVKSSIFLSDFNEI
jgi:hypothetical protein